MYTILRRVSAQSNKICFKPYFIYSNLLDTGSTLFVLYEKSNLINLALKYRLWADTKSPICYVLFTTLWFMQRTFLLLKFLYEINDLFYIYFIKEHLRIFLKENNIFSNSCLLLLIQFYFTSLILFDKDKYIHKIIFSSWANKCVCDCLNLNTYIFL